MKKLAKALLGLVAAVAMLFTGLATSTAAMAADGDPAPTTTYKIEFKDADGNPIKTSAQHTFEAYQVFSGKLSTKTTTGDKPTTTTTLSDIVWGADVDGDAILTALQTSTEAAFKVKAGATEQDPKTNPFAEQKDGNYVVTTAAQVAKILSDNNTGTDNDFAKAFAEVASAYTETLTGDKANNQVSTGAEKTDNSTTPATKYYTYADITGLAAGYYLVKDKANSQDDKENGFTTRYILQVVQNVKVSPKGDVPSVEKKVKDANDSTDTDQTTNNWQDSADHDGNDDISYRLYGTMPSNLADYETYTYKFTDTMSKALSLKNTAADGQAAKYELHVYAVNDKNFDSSKELSTVAAANKAEVKAVASTENDTDEFAKGYTLTYADVAAGTTGTYENGHVLTVNFTDVKKITKEDGTAISVTKDTKFVVEYTAVLDKDKAVIGAGGNPNKVDLTYSNNPNQGGDGKTGKTPEDKVIVFTYQLDINKVTMGEDKTLVPLEGATFKLYKATKVETGQDGNKTYTWDSGTEVKTEATKVEETDSNTGQTKKVTKYISNFKAVDDGVYKLEESVTPEGFNKMKDIIFTITATHDTNSQDPKLRKIDITGLTGAKGDTNSGIISADIENVPGSQLPSTGGMGTVILYIAGVVCVAAAGLWFGLRRRTARH
ncbi:fimbrial protein [Bifidobacterium goeldii]|uniref:Fimbrial protein n=1 Tax=Bifidobacterium goeldii TaxID=2306975 RepID=A0A430FCL7_9BIFI|nr:SpaA isopeptide-forming pilin-related protein [Bifidobacterium goeldii]RSX50585.1 fimbrial protein [Bifidobacterium goeldii]